MKRYQIIIGVLAVLLVTIHASVTAQTGPEELLQSGVYKENVEGDLESAIEIFERIISEFSENRQVAAQALLHLGSIYQKLGNLKAAETYQRLINDFSDQQIAVSEARIRLQKMRYDELANGLQNKDAGPEYQLALDDDCPQLYDNRIRQFDLSPDGKQIVYQGKEGLFVSDNTGTLRHRVVAQNPGRDEWKVNIPPVGQPRWSPDGKWIAYITGKRSHSESDEGWIPWIYKLALVSPDGKQNRLIAPVLDPLPTEGFCWLPDGSGLTYLSSVGAHTISLEGKIIKTVEFETNPSFRLFEYSPDGRWLTLRKKNGDENASHYETDIYVIPSDGGKPVWITNSAGFDSHPTWGADGQTIYFTSARGKGWNIWKVSFDSKTGTVNDDFEQVTFFTDAKVLFPNVVGENDKLLFALSKNLNSVHVADMADPKTYATLSRGTNPSLSPDGKTVYYVGEGATDEEQGIFAMAKENGISRRLTSVRPAAGQKDLSPDGRSLAYFSNIEGVRGLYVLPVDGGKARLLKKNECEACCVAPRWSPDGKLLAYTFEDGLYVIPASGGDPKKLSSLFNWQAWTVRWSPDGKYLAALGFREEWDNNGVYVVPVEGGEAKLLSDFDQWKEGLEWTPNGQSLLYHISVSKSKTIETFLDGRPQEVFFDKPDAWDYVGVWAPDNKSYYFLNSLVSNTMGIDILDTESGELTPFTADNAKLPTWSADGKTIAWTTERAIRQLWLMESGK